MNIKMHMDFNFISIKTRNHCKEIMISVTEREWNVHSYNNQKTPVTPYHLFNGNNI